MVRGFSAEILRLGKAKTSLAADIEESSNNPPGLFQGFPPQDRPQGTPLPSANFLFFPVTLSRARGVSRIE
jgi:hypothetical protein